MRRLIASIFLVLVVAGVPWARTLNRKRIPLPEEYGRMVISNFSDKAGLAPVVFDHWLHRSLFTCRLCHIDVAFAMEEDATRIRAVDNAKGFYCGACHNGKMLHEGKPVFESCSTAKPAKEDAKRCERCHSLGKNVKGEHDFSAFAAKLPKERLGNWVNWELAEQQGIIKPADFVEGLSMKRAAAKSQKDITLKMEAGWMSDIIFSHEKHAFWNGCEVCHPAIFEVRKGATRYSMLEISSGGYCGACHRTVAFPLLDCQRCHSKPVQ